MSSTATPMWSILPNIGGSLDAGGGAGVRAPEKLGGGRQRVLAVLRGLDPEDLGERGDPNLELLGGRLLRRQVPLDLAAGGVEGLGQRGAVVAVAPGEHLDRKRGAAEADHGTGQRARPLDQPLPVSYTH